MTSIPIINKIGSYKYGTRTDVMVLWENMGTYGYVNFEVLSNSIVKFSSKRCSYPRSIMKYKTDIYVLEDLTLISPTIQITSKICNSDAEQDCSVTPTTCSNEVISSTISTNIIMWSGVQPASPQNLVIVPGSNKLTISWDYPSTGYIFCYMIRVWNGTILMFEGYTEDTLHNIEVTGLTNGTTYNVMVHAITTSNQSSDVSSGTGTPSDIACVPLQCTLSLL